MSEGIRFLAHKGQAAMSREWDRIAPERDAELSADLDASFSLVLRPWILERLNDAKTVVDVGCGTGRLTSTLRDRVAHVVGVDPSATSIRIARSHDAVSEYQVATIEDWATSNPSSSVDLAVANMVLMDSPNLDGVCGALSQVARRGRILLTITHPAFWPQYWGYATIPGFDYSRQLVIEAPFKTRSHSYAMTTTHVHRPVGAYLDAFRRNNLHVTHFDELRGPESPDLFPFPRFIGIEATVGTV